LTEGKVAKERISNSDGNKTAGVHFLTSNYGYTDLEYSEPVGRPTLILFLFCKNPSIPGPPKIVKLFKLYHKYARPPMLGEFANASREQKYVYEIL
jgi:hypothetical protein